MFASNLNDCLEEERDILANEGPQYQAVTTLPQETQFQKLALNPSLTGRNAPHNLAFLLLETLRGRSRLQGARRPGRILSQICDRYCPTIETEFINVH